MKKLIRIKRRFVLLFRYKIVSRSVKKRKNDRRAAAASASMTADENSPFGAAMDYVEVLISYAQDMEGELESGSVKRGKPS